MGTKLIKRKDVSILAYGIMVFMIVTMAIAPIVLEYVFTANIKGENGSIYLVGHSHSFLSKFYLYFIGTTILSAFYILSKEIKSRIKRKEVKR